MSDNVFLQESAEPADVNFATIAAIYADGVTLIFDGETAPTQKHYLCNSFAVFAVGDRVRLIKDSGTYIVEYSVGAPKTSFNADTAEYANNAKTAEGAYYANSAGSTQTAQTAETAYTAKNAEKAYGKLESQLSVHSAALLGGEMEGNLSVLQSNQLKDQASQGYIRFRRNGSALEVSFSNYNTGTWYKIVFA